MFDKNPKHARPGSSLIYHANIRDKKQALRRMRASFRKIKVKITPEQSGQPLIATAIYSEITPQGVYVFTKTKLRRKSTVNFKVSRPMAMSVRGVVRFCEPHYTPTQAFRSERTYRVYIEFTLYSELEREAMEDLYFKIRDESYVATRWHHYTNELVQGEMRARQNQARLLEQVEAIQSQPEFAPEGILKTDSTESEAS